MVSIRINEPFLGPCEHQNHVQCPVSHIVAKAHDSPWRGHGTPDPWHHPDSNSWSEFDTSQHVGASTLKNGGKNNAKTTAWDKPWSMEAGIHEFKSQPQKMPRISPRNNVLKFRLLLNLNPWNGPWQGVVQLHKSNMNCRVVLRVTSLHLMSACLHGDVGTVKWNGYAWLCNTS